MFTLQSKNGSAARTNSTFSMVRRPAHDSHAAHVFPNTAGPQSSAASLHGLGQDFSRTPVHSPDGGFHDTFGKPDVPLTAEEPWPEVNGNGGPEVEPQTPVPMDTSKTPSTAPKLKKTDVSAAVGTNCGAFNWVIQWELDKPTTKGGWVVQKVQNTHDIKDCDNKALDGSKLPFQPSWYPFWEAWQINKDQKVTTYAEGGDKLDDTFSSGGTGDSTKGSRTITGEAEFYDGLTLPSSFKVTNKAPTFILPTTKTAPTLTGGTGSIGHSLKASWNCCDGATKKTKVEAT